MTKDDFLKLLIEKEFPEPVLVKKPANGGLGIHTHDFEVMALIVEGLINIQVDKIESSYLPGSVFHLTFAKPHSENYGPQGVTYLASRKIR